MPTLEVSFSNDHLLTNVTGRAMSLTEAIERAHIIKSMVRSVAKDIRTIGRYASELRANSNWKKLDSEYRSWDDCCKSEFGNFRQSIDRFADHYDATKNLPDDCACLITCESQTRPLKGLDDAQVVEVLREVKKESTLESKTGKPRLTAELIKQTREVLYPQEKRVPVPAIITSTQPVQPTFVTEQDHEPDKPTEDEHKEMRDCLSVILRELVKVSRLRKEGLYTRTEVGKMLRPIADRLSDIYNA